MTIYKAVIKTRITQACHINVQSLLISALILLMLLQLFVVNLLKADENFVSSAYRSCYNCIYFSNNYGVRLYTSYIYYATKILIFYS